ncbi:MAG: glycosyltransferase, partial [Anaerolineae bacterium]
DGPTKAQLARRARDMNLPNVTLLPAQPPQAIPDYFNAADVSVAPMKTPHIVGTLPVKIYDSMACGVPVIVAATGEASAVVRDSGSGLVVPPANGPALRAAILRLRDDPHLRAQLGRSGQQVVAAHYSRQAQARQLVALLSQTFGHSPG